MFFVASGSNGFLDVQQAAADTVDARPNTSSGWLSGNQLAVTPINAAGINAEVPIIRMLSV